MPLACSVLVFLFLQIPRFKNMRNGAILVLLVAGAGSAAVYSYFQSYTSISEDEATDERQTSAIYRKELVLNYAPILEAGGWLGWGSMNPPLVIGQKSVDNGYLIVQLSQGKLGVYTFELIGLESVLTLAIFATRFKSRESLFLVFSLMGAMIGLLVSLTTVPLGEQMTQVFFLLLGWGQSLQDTRELGAGATAASMLPEPKFRFRRVIA